MQNSVRACLPTSPPLVWAEILLLLPICFVGCASSASQLQTPRASFYRNQLAEADVHLRELVDESENEFTVGEVDLAMVELFQGDVASAERRLRKVRDDWDHLEQYSLAESAASYLADDTQRAYAGEDYEQMLLRVMLTLCSLQRDGVDAESYSLQTLEKQQDILERMKAEHSDIAASYCVPPVAPYLRGVLRESTHRQYADAEKYYRQASALLPESRSIMKDIERVETGVHSQPGNGAVYLIALIGRGPQKRETTAPVTQSALLAAEAILSSLGEYSIPPSLAPVKIPEIVCSPRPFDTLGVELAGQAIATTEVVTDIHAMAQETYEYELPGIMARTVARRIVKKGAIYAAKDQLDVTSDLTSLAMDAAGVLWEATEHADTRCWGLLPREIQVLRLELPAGTHQLKLEPVTQGRPVAPGVIASVNVSNGRNTFLLTYWPDTKPIGNLLISQ